MKVCKVLWTLGVMNVGVLNPPRSFLSFLGFHFREKTACSCHKSCCTQLSDPLCPWPTVILNAVSQRKMWTTSILCWTEFSGVLTSRAGDPSGVAFQPASMSLILPNVSISHTKEPILENAVNVSPWYSSINGDQQWQKYLLTRNGMKGKLLLKYLVLSWLSIVGIRYNNERKLLS